MSTTPANSYMITNRNPRARLQDAITHFGKYHNPSYPGRLGLSGPDYAACSSRRVLGRASSCRALDPAPLAAHHLLMDESRADPSSQRSPNAGDQDAGSPPNPDNQHDSEDLSDTLQETRIVLQGSQMLTAFLIAVPFTDRFHEARNSEQSVYLATFFCAVASLILFSAPSAVHRLLRPLRDRMRFKKFATRMVIIGLVPLSFALMLATDLVVSLVLGDRLAMVAAGLVGGLIGFAWWIMPLVYRRREARA